MDTAADTFEAHRGLLYAIAYRMTGSVGDSEDLVQDAFLRWQRADHAMVDSPKAFLTTIITRLALDYMKSARVRRETYVGPWLPEPVAETKRPDETAAMADSITMAFLLLLERLSPRERAAYLLREVFDYPYAELAVILDVSEANCRQYVRRAKQHLADHRARYEVPPDKQQNLVAEFLRACAESDTEGLAQILAEDAILYSDGGGVVLAARNPIYGADKISRFLIGVLGKAEPAERSIVIQDFNGEPGCVILADGVVENSIVFEMSDGVIQRIYAVRNPEKLGHLAGLYN